MAASAQREPQIVRSRDACVVERVSLAPVIHEFVDGWERADIGAVAWLAEKSGVPEKTIQNITNTRSERGRFTELKTADALLTTIGNPHLLSDGTITVKPRWRTDRARSQCCGVPRTFPEWSLEPTRF